MAEKRFQIRKLDPSIGTQVEIQETLRQLQEEAILNDQANYTIGQLIGTGKLARIGKRSSDLDAGSGRFTVALVGLWIASGASLIATIFTAIKLIAQTSQSLADTNQQAENEGLSAVSIMLQIFQIVLVLVLTIFLFQACKRCGKQARYISAVDSCIAMRQALDRN